jgi:hypothetical protein
VTALLTVCLRPRRRSALKIKRIDVSTTAIMPETRPANAKLGSIGLPLTSGRNSIFSRSSRRQREPLRRVFLAADRCRRAGDRCGDRARDRAGVRSGRGIWRPGGVAASGADRRRGPLTRMRAATRDASSRPALCCARRSSVGRIAPRAPQSRELTVSIAVWASRWKPRSAGRLWRHVTCLPRLLPSSRGLNAEIYTEPACRLRIVGRDTAHLYEAEIARATYRNARRKRRVRTRYPVEMADV